MLGDLLIIGVGEGVAEVDVTECKEEEEEEEEVVADKDRVVPVAVACDNGDRFFHAIRSFISAANKQKGTPARALLLLSVSSMHTGAGGRAGRGRAFATRQRGRSGYEQAVNDLANQSSAPCDRG